MQADHTPEQMLNRLFRSIFDVARRERALVMVHAFGL
jgi:hypothetical protein